MKNLHIFKSSILITALLFLSLGIMAQAPKAISYQAVIRDSGGDLVQSGPVGVKVTIQAKSTLGAFSDVYSETHAATSNVNGLITLEIGRGTPVLGTFATIDWLSTSKKDYYLKVETDPTGGTSYTAPGLSEILSAPYALVATEALTVRNEDDPVFEASVAKKITATDTTNWNSISLDDAYNNGRTITADNGPVEVNGTDGFISEGILGSGNNLYSNGAGTIMFWYPKKSVFRAGTVTSGVWDLSQIGEYSTAFGYNTAANDTASTAMGYKTTASGLFSTAMGNESRANGMNATAMGYNTLAMGSYSTAMGYESQAVGKYSTAIGKDAIASGERSIALGNGARAAGEASISFGDGYARGEYSTAMGSGEANTDYSVAMGSLTRTGGNAAFAMGFTTFAGGDASTAMGDSTEAFGDASTAMGHRTIARGDASTAIGAYTTASGLVSTAMGAFASTNEQPGSFVIGDASTYGGTNAIVQNSQPNQMMMRFASGYRLYTNSTSNIGVLLSAGGSSWTSISDSTKKENYKASNGEYFLSTLPKLKLGSWNYKGQSPELFRHYGPMAQEIFNYFGNDGIGTIGCDTTLASADMDGIIMICLQALESRTQELQNQNQQLSEANQLLTQRLEAIEIMLSKLVLLDVNNKNTETAHKE